MASVADIFSDPIRMEQVVRAIEEASRTIRDIDDTFHRIDETATAVAKKLGVEVEKIERSTDRFGRELKKGAEDAKREWGTFYDFVDRKLDEHQRKWRQNMEETNRQLHLARGGLGAAGGDFGLGLSGGKGVMSAMQSMPMQIIGRLPLGGLAGLMLYGAMKEEGFRAKTTEIMRTMDRLGGSARQNAKEVNADLRTFMREWGSNGEEIMATMQALSEFNIGDERFDKLASASNKAGVSVQRVATALDMVSKLQPGTTAKAIGEAMVSTGKSAGDLAQDFMNLREAARANQVDFQGLMSVMSQGTSTLRMQRQGVGDLSSAYFKLREGLQAHAGMSKQQASMAAMQGISAVAGSIGGMNEGLMGYIAQRIQRRTGQGPADPFEAMMSLRLGETTGGKNDFMGQVVTELQGAMQEHVGGSRERRIGALSTQGFDVEAARAIIDMNEGGTSLKDVTDAMRDPQKLMLEAFRARSSEANRFERAMEKLMFDIAKIGSGTLMVLGAGFKSLLGAMYYMSQGETGRAAALLQRGAGAEDKGFARIRGGFSSMGQLGGQLGKMLDETDFDTGIEAYEREKTRRTQGPQATSTAADIGGSVVVGGGIGGGLVQVFDKLMQEGGADAKTQRDFEEKQAAKMTNRRIDQQRREKDLRDRVTVHDQTGGHVEVVIKKSSAADTSKAELPHGG